MTEFNPDLKAYLLAQAREADIPLDLGNSTLEMMLSFDKEMFMLCGCQNEFQANQMLAALKTWKELEASQQDALMSQPSQPLASLTPNTKTAISKLGSKVDQLSEEFQRIKVVGDHAGGTLTHAQLARRERAENRFDENAREEHAFAELNSEPCGTVLKFDMIAEESLSELATSRSKDGPCVQKWFCDSVVEMWNTQAEHSGRYIKDTHTKPVRGMKGRPDGWVGLDSEANLISCLFWVELKGGSNEFSDADLGELIEYNEHVITRHRFRQYMYIVLMNTRRIYVLKSSMQGHFVHHQCVFDGTLQSKGWNVFCHMLTMTPQDLGYCLPKLPMFEKSGSLKITDWLGRGSSSQVFQVTSTSTDSGKAYVCKILHEEKRAIGEAETLERLANNRVKHVPTLVERQGTHLLEEPVGRHFSAEHRISSTQFSDLVDCLKDAHTAGIVHRDVSRRNIFWLAEGGVLLNDWGSACDKDDRKSYEGVVHEAGPSVLRQLKDQGSNIVQSRASDDLHALARTVYIMLNWSTSGLPPHEDPDFGEVLAFWEQVVVRSNVWRDLFASAEKCDYEEFRSLGKQWIDSLHPSVYERKSV